VGYTDDKGEVLFENVGEGVCNVIAEDKHHRHPAAYMFVATDGQTETVSFALNPESAKVIATVRSRRDSLSERHVGLTSPQRTLDDGLAGALGLQPDVLQNASGFSIDGKDKSQTGYSVDGVPVAGLGTTGLQGVDSDLFAGASVGTTASNGSLGGTIGYETALPTFSWVTSGVASLGALDSHSERLLTTGSIGDVGIVAAYAFRDTLNFADGKRYLDASGLDYIHGGLLSSRGALAKVRIPAGALGSLTFTGISSNGYNDITCPYNVGPVPCGFGPGLSGTNSDRRLTVNYQSVIGRTNVALAYFGALTHQSQDLSTRTIALAPFPLSSNQAVAMHGLIGSVTGGIGPRNVISANLTTFGFTDSFSQQLPYAFQWRSSSSYFESEVADSYIAGRSLTLRGSVGLSRTAGTPTDGRASVGFTYQAGAHDTVTGSLNGGDQQVALQSPSLPSDPPSLIYDCINHQILGQIQGDTPGAQHSMSASLGWEHRAATLRLFANAGVDIQDGIPASTIVNAASLPGSALPPGYIGQVQAFAASSSGCPVATFNLPTDLFFEASVNDVRRMYATLRFGYAGQITNSLQVGLFGTLVQARATSTDPLLSNPYSIYIPGRQIPNVPSAKATLLLDYRYTQSPIEEIVGFQYLSANSPFNLPASLQVSAGIAWNSRAGKLVLSGRNLTNAFPGDFYSNGYSVPLGTIGGQPFGTIAQPFHERSFSIQFMPRIGPTSTERTASTQIDQSTMAASGFVQAETEPLPAMPPKDPIQLRDTSGTCEAQTYRKLRPDVDALKAFIAGLVPGAPTSTRDFGTISATYIPWGATFAVEIKPKTFNASIAFFNCVAFHQGTLDEYRARGLYVPPNSSPGDVSFLFSPSVGIYLYQRSPDAGPVITYSPLPSTKPANPFVIRNNCPRASRPIVQSLLGILEPILTAQKPGVQEFDGGTIATKMLPSGDLWSDVSISDVFAVNALQSCLTFAAPDGRTMLNERLEGAPLPDINFTLKFGFYVVGR
jgi:hypothetical protein